MLLTVKYCCFKRNYWRNALF